MYNMGGSKIQGLRNLGINKAEKLKTMKSPIRIRFDINSAK